MNLSQIGSLEFEHFAMSGSIQKTNNVITTATSLIVSVMEGPWCDVNSFLCCHPFLVTKTPKQNQELIDSSQGSLTSSNLGTDGRTYIGTYRAGNSGNSDWWIENSYKRRISC